jgi:hypothetical protein
VWGVRLYLLAQRAGGMVTDCADTELPLGEPSCVDSSDRGVPDRPVLAKKLVMPHEADVRAPGPRDELGVVSTSSEITALIVVSIPSGHRVAISR